MRILIAFDGSPGSSTAVDLASRIPWPDGSVIRLVHADGEGAPLAEAAARLARPGVDTEHAVIRGGDAGKAIVAEAQRWSPDLVVAGSRGHGPLATAFIGSVAVHLTEHAPCPVLIARRTAWERFVFAEDGSDSARAARRIVASSPIFSGRSVRVVSVAQVQPPLLSGVTASVRREAGEAMREAELEARAAHGRLATESAKELTTAGVLADSEVRSGDPAEEIVAGAQNVAADAVVLGSRGRSPLARAVLGSVARLVLLRAPCSVLVVRS